LDKVKKKALITEYAKHEGDTGSSEVQVAILTNRIKQLAGHMQANKHDQHSKRALMILIGQRKRHLSYISKEDLNQYRTLITRLGLRK
jgi:small subunit ribosomal protein S15